MYGNVKADDVQGDSTFVKPVAGFVDNVEITYFGLGTDKEGNVSENRAELHLKQPNGAVIRTAFFEPSESDNPKAPSYDDQMTNLFASLKHVATKVDPDSNLVAEAQENSSDFKSFINSLSLKIKEKLGDKNFRVAFTYDKNGYVNVRKFPNWIESMETPREGTILGWNPKYDSVEPPVTNGASESVYTEDNNADTPDW